MGYCLPKLKKFVEDKKLAHLIELKVNIAIYWVNRQKFWKRLRKMLRIWEISNCHLKTRSKGLLITPWKAPFITKEGMLGQRSNQEIRGRWSFQKSQASAITVFLPRVASKVHPSQWLTNLLTYLTNTLGPKSLQLTKTINFWSTSSANWVRTSLC